MFQHYVRRNHLYRLRRIRGLQQKQLARLLGYRSTSMVSRLEAGTALPTLKTSLLLQLALGAHLSEIYVDLNARLEVLILKRSMTLPRDLGRHIRGRLLGRD